MDSISADGIRGTGPIGTLVVGLILSSVLGLDASTVLSICLLLYVGAKVLPSLLDSF